MVTKYEGWPTTWVHSGGWGVKIKYPDSSILKIEREENNTSHSYFKIGTLSIMESLYF